VIGERLRRASESRQFAHDGKLIPVTISVGLAGMPDAGIKDASALVAAADAALYRSKQGGRNRVRAPGAMQAPEPEGDETAADGAPDEADA